MEPPNILAEAQSFLRNHAVSGTILFAMVTGSHAYNLANEESDVDYLGVYLGKTQDLLSFTHVNFPTISTLPNGPKPDITLYEAHQCLKLLIQGNPFLLETLFVDEYCYETEIWRELRKMRNTFLNKNTVEAIISYVEKQMAVQEKRPMVGKRIYHIIRLLYEVNRIIDSKLPIIAIRDGPERNHLVEIRADKGIEHTKIVEEAQKMIQDIRKKPWNIPDKADEKIVSDWLVLIRKLDLNSTKDQQWQ